MLQMWNGGQNRRVNLAFGPQGPFIFELTPYLGDNRPKIWTFARKEGYETVYNIVDTS